MSYIDTVSILFATASRRYKNLGMHLPAICSIIPWCFAYDKVNCAPYLPVYYLDKVNLPDEHLGLHGYFQQEGFAIQLTSESPFALIPVDQAVEETVSKHTQTAGGVKGFSLKPSSVQKHSMISEF